MRTIKEVYPDKFKERWDEIYDYQPMIDEIGKVVIQVDDDDYQGDSRILYRDGNRIGYLNFGWGSCSGCDALQACGSYAEVQSLMDDLVRSVQWFDTESEALNYFQSKDWDKEYSWHAEEQKRFINQCIKYLKGESNE